jgi:hypothetical protein
MPHPLFILVFRANLLLTPAFIIVIVNYANGNEIRAIQISFLLR